MNINKTEKTEMQRRPEQAYGERVVVRIERAGGVQAHPFLALHSPEYSKVERWLTTLSSNNGNYHSTLGQTFVETERDQTFCAKHVLTVFHWQSSTDELDPSQLALPCASSSVFAHVICAAPTVTISSLVLKFNSTTPT
jgi:hypothetical protein